ncbi:MAG: hypothetical protein EOO05_15255, partial [Chitinophagaceae bacterium]
MKRTILSCLLILCGSCCIAQFSNPGFELPGSGSSIASGWNVFPVEGYSASLVADAANSGRHSLKMVGSGSDRSKFMNVSQNLAVDYRALKKIRITAFVKTRELQGNVALWCQIWDGNRKRIGFENSGMQGLTVSGTGDWKQVGLDLLLPREAKSLVFGAYTMGTGTVWFDDFAVQELAGSGGPPSAEVLALSREFNAIVRKSAIYRDSIDWKVMDEDLAELGRGLKTANDAQVLHSYVLGQLRKAGDNHSFLQNKVAAQNYASATSVQGKPEARLLEGGVGYISVPGFGSVNRELMESFASSIQKLIGELDQGNDIKGWVVDL